MPLSFYARAVESRHAPDTVYLFSLRTGGLIEADRDLVARIFAGKPDQDEAEILAANGILVADRDAEQRDLLDFFAQLDRHSPVLNLCVIINLRCNFACRYCFQGSLKQGERMDDAVIAQSAAFILDRLRRHDKKRLVLDFYGGEPLMTPEIIRAFATRLAPGIEAEDREFSFTLVSNGSLLTPELARELSGIGLAGVRITVDGPPEIHNHYRPYAGGGPTFDRIMDNIVAIADIVKVTLSGNYSRDNFRRFPELLDLLPGYGLGPDRVEVRFNPVLQTRDSFTLPEFAFGCASINEPWLPGATIFIRREMMKRGYRPPDIRPAPCMVEMADSLTLGPDGRLYKCISMVGHDKFAVGDVGHGLGDISVYRPRQWRRREQCRACGYLPLCFGGCRYLVYERRGNMDGVDCERGFLDHTLDEMIRIAAE